MLSTPNGEGDGLHAAMLALSKDRTGVSNANVLGKMAVPDVHGVGCRFPELGVGDSNRLGVAWFILAALSAANGDGDGLLPETQALWDTAQAHTIPRLGYS